MYSRTVVVFYPITGTSVDLSKLEMGTRFNLELILCCQHTHNIYKFKNVLIKYIATIHSLFLIHSNTL